MGDRLAPVEVDGQTAYVLAEHLEQLPIGGADLGRAAPARLRSSTMLGPGTDDGHVVRPSIARTSSRTAGWIAPVVTLRAA
jgi:hypothetical protein